MLSVTLLFIQLIFLALGSAVSVIFPKIKSVISVSLGIVFVFFMIGMISSGTDDTVLRYFTPFNYFDSFYIMDHSAYETSFLVTGAIVIIVSILISYIVFLKKDLS